MSTEDIYEERPVHHLKDCSFIVVTNETGKSDRHPEPTKDEAEAYARIKRIKVRGRGSVEVVELKHLRGAA